MATHVCELQDNEEIGVESLTENFLTCIICTEQYKDPKVLPCLHSFCSHCLEQYLTKRGTQLGQNYPCPLCQQSTTLPSAGISGIKTNFLLNSLQGFVEKTNSSSTSVTADAVCSICTPTDKTKPATHQCLDCDDNLCETCAECHCRTKLTIDHIVLPLATIREDEEATMKLKASRRIKLCPKHPDEKLKFYCIACSCVICSDCKVLEHDTHSCTSVQKAAQACDQHIEELQKQLQHLIMSETRELDRVKTQEKLLTDNIETVKKSIQVATQTAVNVVTKSSQRLQEEAHSKYTQNKDKFDSQNQQLTDEMSHLSRTSDFVKFMLTSGSSIEKIRIESIVKEQADFYKTDKSADGNLEQAEVQFLEFRKAEFNLNLGKLTMESDPGKFHKENTNDFPKVKQKTQQPSQHLNVPKIIVCFGTSYTSDDTNSSPSGVFVNQNNNIIVTDKANHQIKCYSKSGNLLFLFTDSQRKQSIPVDVTCFKDFVIVTYKSGCLKVFDGNTGDFLQVCNTFNSPAGICTIGNTGCIIVYNEKNNVLSTTIMGSTMPHLTELNSNIPLTDSVKCPSYVATNCLNVIAVSDSDARCVHFMDKKGTCLGKYESVLLKTPAGVCSDHTGNFYVADTSGNCIHMIDRKLDFLRIAADDTFIKRPTAIAYSEDVGGLVVAETGGTIKVLKLQTS